MCLFHVNIALTSDALLCCAAAISENADKLQMGEISMMRPCHARHALCHNNACSLLTPTILVLAAEGLVKISQSLYEVRFARPPWLHWWAQQRR